MMCNPSDLPLPEIANGCYTLHNVKRDTHRTFRIRTAKKGGLKGKRIVELLTGPDNTNDYTAFGFLNPNCISVWKSKQQTTTYLNYAEFFFKMLKGAKCESVEMKTEKFCLICNRKLTNPESIDNNIGPECAKKGKV